MNLLYKIIIMIKVRFIFSVVLLFLGLENVLAQDSEVIDYYSCSCTDSTSYYIILQSGPKDKTTSFWGIDKSDIMTFQELDISRIDFNEMIEKAKSSIRKKMPFLKTLTFTKLELKRISKKIENDSRNWIVMITFEKDNKGFFEMVPVLLDGRIVLSKWIGN